MGSILSSRVREDGKIVVESCLDYEEALQLKGNIENIHIFSENASNIKANIAQRGKNEATKYFLIPKELRKNLSYKNKTSCQKIETKSKVIFVYIIDKLKA
ncbi:MAG: hypothetical protein V1660_03555 [archaeon]